MKNIVHVGHRKTGQSLAGLCEVQLLYIEHVPVGVWLDHGISQIILDIY